MRFVRAGNMQQERVIDIGAGDMMTAIRSGKHLHFHLPRFLLPRLTRLLFRVSLSSSLTSVP